MDNNLQLHSTGASLMDLNDCDSGTTGGKSDFDIRVEVWGKGAPQVTNVMLTDEQIPYVIEELCKYLSKK